MTTAFQWVFDNASQISINKRGVVAQTISRDQTLRTTSRGGQIWRFDVTMPSGQRWSEARPYITAMEALDRHTEGTVQINNSGYNSWLTGYQGDSDVITGWTASWTTGNTVTLTGTGSGHNLTNGEVTLKTGDFIQLGSNSVYEVASDVIYPNTTVTLHRPLLEATSSDIIHIAQNVTWTVKCVNFPNWTIIDRDIVSFTGPFTFYEAIN
jgi:hypothetical protein